MQLDPGQPLSTQFESAAGIGVEKLTAAACASVGYTVFRNVLLELSGETAAEADVFAALFTPLRESRVLLECKGGKPSFNDIRKFASFRQLLSPAPDDLILIARPGCRANRKELGHHLGVKIVERTNLTYYALPLLGGLALRRRRASELNRYLAWYDIHEYLIDRTPGVDQLRQHYRFLITQLWQIGPAVQQLERSFAAYTTDFPQTWSAVAQEKNLDERDALYEASDDDFEAAMYVVLLHRLMNAYAVTRRTLEVIRHESPEELIESTGPALRSAISDLSGQPRFLFGFPSFLQNFLFVWGGFIVESLRDQELALMAEQAGTAVAAVEHYLRVLDAMYQGVEGGLFNTWEDYYYFKYVPAAFRALGFIHRQAMNSETYGARQFFGTSHDRYLAALGRALASEGGLDGLRFGVGAP